MENEYMTIRAAADLLGVSVSHVHRMVKRGELTAWRNPIYRKGGPVRVPRSEVDVLADLARLPKPKPPPGSRD